MKINILFLFSLIFILSACSSGSSANCRMADKRFVCSGELSTTKGLKINFSRLPEGKFYFASAHYQAPNSAGDYMYVADCNLPGSRLIETNKDYVITCPFKGPGDYMINFDISHAEHEDYQPHNSETCLKKNNKWQCEINGSYKQ